jgi:hypothetical protein
MTWHGRSLGSASVYLKPRFSERIVFISYAKYEFNFVCSQNLACEVASNLDGQMLTMQFCMGQTTAESRIVLKWFSVWIPCGQ